MPHDDPTMQRLEDQIQWYDSRSIKNQRMFKVLKMIVIFSAALIPFLVGPGPTKSPVVNPPVPPPEPPVVGRPVTRPEPETPLGLIGNGDTGEGAKGKVQAQVPWSRSSTVALFGVGLALAVSFIGTFFYLDSTKKADQSPSQPSSASHLPSAETAPSTLPSAKPSLSAVVPDKPLQHQDGASLLAPSPLIELFGAALDARQKALELVESTADRICNVVTPKGEAKSSEVKGIVAAQLRGLASKLADVGVSEAGRINNEEFQSVLRNRLAITLNDNAECKLIVFDILSIKLFISMF